MTSQKSRVVALITGVLVLASGLAVGPGFAADKAQPSTPTVRGVVKSASATALVVETGTPGKELRLVLDERTIVMAMKPFARIAVSDLRKGDPVTVSYVEEGGRSVAKRVWRRPAESAAAARPAKAKPAASR